MCLHVSCHICRRVNPNYGLRKQYLPAAIFIYELLFPNDNKSDPVPSTLSLTGHMEISKHNQSVQVRDKFEILVTLPYVSLNFLHRN